MTNTSSQLITQTEWLCTKTKILKSKNSFFAFFPDPFVPASSALSVTLWLIYGDASFRPASTPYSVFPPWFTLTSWRGRQYVPPKRYQKNLTFMWQNIVINLLQYNQLDALISQIYFWNETLHVSDSSSVHHQELFTVHTAMVQSDTKNGNFWKTQQKLKKSKEKKLLTEIEPLQLAF